MGVDKPVNIPGIIKDFSPEKIKHPTLGKPLDYWEYKNATGETLGFVCLFSIKRKGKTEKLPLPFTPLPSGEYGNGVWNRETKEWTNQQSWVGFSDPKPIYGAELLAAYPDRPVIVVEGEKCAEAGRSVFGDHAVCICWQGGTNSIALVDWTPLFERRVAYWPDADPQGFKCAFNFNALILPIASRMLFIAPFADVKPGWDIADFVLEAEAQRIREFFTDQLLTYGKFFEQFNPVVVEWELENQKRLEAAAAKRAEERELKTKREATLKTPTPFQPLGYNNGTYYYFSLGAKQVVALRAADHSNRNLLQLAPAEWWEAKYPTKTGVNWLDAQSDLVKACHAKAVFTPSMIRGRGAWWDGDTVVVHLGDRLLVDAVDTPLVKYKSKYIYPASEFLELSQTEPMSAEESSKIITASKQILWTMPASAYLLSGWIVCAVIGGALKWRPHAWITGGSGSGKTTIMRDFVHPLVGVFARYVQGESSEAGIRQMLRGDSLPVLFDEAEGTDKSAANRVSHIIALMRSSSSESGAVTVKGSSQGNYQSFNIRSAFILASIGVQVNAWADASRIAVLALQTPPIEQTEAQRKTRTDHYDQLRVLLSDFNPEYSSRLLARCFSMIPVIRRNADIFGGVSSTVFNSARLGEQYGALLAGAYSLTADGNVTPEQANRFIESQDWSEHTQSTEAKDHDKCLATLMAYQVMIEGVNGRGNRQISIGEMVEIAARGHGFSGEYEGWELADYSLRRHGFRLMDGYLYIANSHSQIKKALRETAWAAGWNRVLRDVRNARPSEKTVRFAPGVISRAVGMPLDAILGDAAPPDVSTLLVQDDDAF